MIIKFTEPTMPKYIYINPQNNQVHLLVPVVGGQEISTDNTCKLTAALDEFFQKGGALRQLKAYKTALEFDLQFLVEGHLLQAPKQERLTQINAYIKALTAMPNMSSNEIFTSLMQQPSNLYSIQLRPREQDRHSRVINPVFSINRGNDTEGTPSSALYNALHAAAYYPDASTAPTPREQLSSAVLDALPPQLVDFNAIQTELKKQCHDLFSLDIDFTKNSQGIAVNITFIDALMGFTTNKPATQQNYIDALLWSCAANIDVNILALASPFFIVQNDEMKAEKLSIMTQFFLAHVNIHCAANGISRQNFGTILDASDALSNEVAARVISALGSGTSVEDSLCAFFNEHATAFGLTRPLAPDEINVIKQTFERTYNTVTATNENPHMDDFMIMDTTHCGKFVTHQGAICTNFAELLRRSPFDNAYFQGIRTAFQTEPKPVIPHKNEHIKANDMEMTFEELLAHYKNDEQFAKLPMEIQVKCFQSPEYQRHTFLHQVAKGKQDNAKGLLATNHVNMQTLLTSIGTFTDYSGRTFTCTAYEYANWAKDTHMCRMLEGEMDTETKAVMLNRIDEIRLNGLTYTQHNNTITGSTHFNLDLLKTAYGEYIEAYDTYNNNAVVAAWMKVGLAQRDLPVHYLNEYFRQDRTFLPLPSFNEPKLPRGLTFYNYITHQKETFFALEVFSSSGLGINFAFSRSSNTNGGWGGKRAGWDIKAAKKNVINDLLAVSRLDAVRTEDLIQSYQNLEPAGLGPILRGTF